MADGEEEYCSYEYVKFYQGGFWLLWVGKEDVDSGISFAFTQLEEIWQVRVGNCYENPEMMKLTECYPLHPDAIRDHEQTC